MSTRCQIKIVDESQELWFYRHSDGYPSSVMPDLRKLLAWVKEGKLRDNVEQTAGWLVLLGAQEYAYEAVFQRDHTLNIPVDLHRKEPEFTMTGWKVGAYEPCPCRDFHDDIEFFYVLDLHAKTLSFAEYDSANNWETLIPDDGRRYE